MTENSSVILYGLFLAFLLRFVCPLSLKNMSQSFQGFQLERQAYFWLAWNSVYPMRLWGRIRTARPARALNRGCMSSSVERCSSSLTAKGTRSMVLGKSGVVLFFFMLSWHGLFKGVESFTALWIKKSYLWRKFWVSLFARSKFPFIVSCLVYSFLSQSAP